jgi:hypothetical protein
MADGRDIIEQVHAIIQEVSGRLAGLKPTFSDQELAEFTGYIESSQKWLKLCRKKVWLRGAEGTGMAQVCLDKATQLRDSLSDPCPANVAAAALSQQLESLARVISTKAQILT